MKIPIARPFIGDEEKAAICRILESGMLAQGNEVASFEEEFRTFIGTREAIAVSNGTTALFVGLKALGIGEGDFVVTTPFTFISSATSILHCGARPLFCDVDDRTFNLDPNRLEDLLKQKRSIKAIVTVHLYGLPSLMPEILSLSGRYGVPVIEDCAQSHGAGIAGKLTGSFGTLSTFSFYPTKNMTTGEGGMITTGELQIADRCRMLINHGSRRRYEHETIGYNFRMTDIAAALGRVQLGRLAAFNQKRRENAEYFTAAFQSLPGILVPLEPAGYTSVYHQYTLRIALRRDALAGSLAEGGISTGIYYPIPVHRQPAIQPFIESIDYPRAENLAREVLSLPIYPLLTDDEREEIANLVVAFMKGELA
ncbi:MAG TPA: DegT/DnrJ/EryC1/StrS family aminotransferase [Atribacteraceae bacterium]|nr:DegT/DnrJ/EryC1/StrS family aminotransferase [Atribacteraceae bacterium]